MQFRSFTKFSCLKNQAFHSTSIDNLLRNFKNAMITSTLVDRLGSKFARHQDVHGPSLELSKPRNLIYFYQ